MTATRRAQLNAAARRYWRRQAATRTAAGLNTRGELRRYRQRPELASLTGPARAARRRQLVARENKLLGLTTRGTRRLRRLGGRLDRNARLRFYTLANHALGRTARGTPRRRRHSQLP